LVLLSAFAVCCAMWLAAGQAYGPGDLSNSLQLIVEERGGEIVATLKNVGSAEQTVYSSGELAGRGLGNTYSVVINARQGASHPPCVTFYGAADTGEKEVLAVRSEKQLVRTNAHSISILHCLPLGEYDILLIHRIPDGRIVVSNSIKITAGDEKRFGTSGSVPLSDSR
jgi:hypothetical protein